MKKLSSLIYIIASFAALLLLWSALIRITGVSPALLPGPLAVGKAGIELFADGVMFRHLAASMGRFATGYLASVIAGTILGLLLGYCPVGYRFAAPVLHFLRPIAPVAWMPFIVLLIGIGDVPAIIIIFLAGFFPVLLSTTAAVRRLEPVYYKVAANYNIAFPAILWKIIFPAIFPAVANSLHIALGSAWIFLVSGEMIGAQSGLGYLIIDARNNMRTDYLLAAMVMIGLVGLGLDLLVGKAEKAILIVYGVDGNVY